MKAFRFIVLASTVALGALSWGSASALPTVMYNNGAVTLDGAFLGAGGACGWSDESANSAARDEVLSECGVSTSLTEQYKGESSGSESGPMAASYGTTFGTYGAGDGINNATVKYVFGASYFDCTTCILFVKDGSAGPNAYGFHIDNWDGVSDIVLTGFFDITTNSKGVDQSISHLSIYGSGTVTVCSSTDPTCSPPPNNVPEPGSLALAGLALAAAGWSRRRRA